MIYDQNKPLFISIDFQPFLPILPYITAFNTTNERYVYRNIHYTKYTWLQSFNTDSHRTQHRLQSNPILHPLHEFCETSTPFPINSFNFNKSFVLSVDCNSIENLFIRTLFGCSEWSRYDLVKFMFVSIRQPINSYDLLHYFSWHWILMLMKIKGNQYWSNKWTFWCFIAWFNQYTK